MQAFGGCKKSRFYRRKAYAERNSSRVFFTISGVGKEAGNEIHLVSNTICLKFVFVHGFSRPFWGFLQSSLSRANHECLPALARF